ncbi:four-helix bundle copper-binding protein [Paraburkholderia gardini]
MRPPRGVGPRHPEDADHCRVCSGACRACAQAGRAM